MKTINNTVLQTNLNSTLDSAQKESILIMRDGKPCAVLRGIADYDEEDLRLARSPEFWQMIQERRQSGTSVALKDVERRLRAKERALSLKRQKRTQKSLTTKRGSKR